MHTILKRTRALLDRNLGRCPRCMRQAFLAAAGAWALAVAVRLGIDSDLLAITAAAAALGLTLLWIGHLVAYAGRTHAIAPAGADAPAVGAPIAMTRREAIPTFARALAAIAVATALPTRSAFAQRRCDCSKCRPDQSCCPTAGGQCGCFPMRCP